MTIAALDPGARMLVLDWHDGERSRYPFLWLKDNDPSGLHPETGERVFDLTTVDPALAPTAAHIDGGALVLEWPDAPGTHRLPLDWLRTHAPGRPLADPADVAPAPWRAELGAAGIPRADAAALLTSDAALEDWLRRTRATGLSLVEGLADSIEAGQDVARRIGFLRRTNFGVTFEVETKPHPNNLAYTPVRLPLHTDLPNQELPPGFQFLHCLANEAAGGGSLFCDGYALVEDLRREAPEAFDLLARVAIPFRFHDADTDLRTRRPVIVTDPAGRVAEVCFNAHIAGVFDMAPELVEPYYAAYRRLMVMSRDPAYLVTLKLSAGEMVVFDNRRVLHGREAFDPNTGRRHLHGCYVDRGEFDSRLRVLARERART